MGLKGTFELMQAKPSSMLLVMELPGVGSIRNGYDGKIAWATNPMMGPMLIDGTALGQLRLQAHFDAQMHDPARYAVIETVGRTEFEGEDCHRVRLVAKPTEDLGEETEKLREIFEYYSVESGLLMGTESLNASPMGEMKVRSYYSDYVELGGVKTPRTVVQDAGMQKMKLVTEELSLIGFVFGMQQTEVNPPAAAARAPDSIVSLYSWPGSRRWT